MNKRTIKAKPVVKWAGGKGQLLPQLTKYLPKELVKGEIKNYVEPFLGGGALFFEIAQKYNVENFYLSDLNKDLILMYKVIQQKSIDLLDELKQYQKKYMALEEVQQKDFFLEIRDVFNDNKSISYDEIDAFGVKRSAQFIFLNKTCFNGLYRVNSKGQFNVPFGKYKKPNIVDEYNVLSVSKALENVKINSFDYLNSFDLITKETFIYFDPPYRPISSTSSFTTYTGAAFGDEEQIELANFFKKIDKEKGAKIMYSNSDPKNENSEDDFFENIFSEYNIFRIQASRSINSDATKRGKINELLITNYNYEPRSLEFDF